MPTEETTRSRLRLLALAAAFPALFVSRLNGEKPGVKEWSADGTRIAFQSNRNGNLDIFVMSADGTNVAQLTADPAHGYLTFWSLDGSKITFASWHQEPDDSTSEVHTYIMNADGASRRRCTGALGHQERKCEHQPLRLK